MRVMCSVQLWLLLVSCLGSLAVKSNSGDNEGAVSGTMVRRGDVAIDGVGAAEVAVQVDSKGAAHIKDVSALQVNATADAGLDAAFAAQLHELEHLHRRHASAMGYDDLHRMYMLEDNVIRGGKRMDTITGRTYTFREFHLAQHPYDSGDATEEHWLRLDPVDEAARRANAMQRAHY
mmetsp:Transcript_50118/g.92499  ORF Transcript_50118/g.92499 Transcript_50118/m.92499 type:complete len:177 (-) Transcript_50118:121-651(-)